MDHDHTTLPEDHMPPEDQPTLWDLLELEPPDVGDVSLADEEVALPIASGTNQDPESEPGTPPNTWERYLASFSPETNPDVAEQTLRDRADALDLVDARFIGIEYQDAGGQSTGYSVGCIEVYGVGDRFLEVAQFDDAVEAAMYYDELQGPVEKGDVAVHAVHQFAEFAAREQGTPIRWQEAERDHLDIYEWYAGQDTAREAGRSPDGDVQKSESLPAFNALSAIGIAAEDFDPDRDPPPFYDPATGTAYWVGIFQADADAPVDCIASILSLGRNPETGQIQAQLAPCVPGDWDKAYASSQHLLDVLADDGLDACFLAAESMAIATDQRDLWENSRGVTLARDYAQQAADYTRQTWDLEL